MDLNAIRVFIKVVQAGSFVRAARQLGIPSSTASAKVSALEASLGVTLLQRTTRKLHLTEAGQLFFIRCLKGFDEISSAEAEVKSAQEEVKGHLRVTAPFDLGSTCLMGLISAFKRKYPRVTLELILSDSFKDLLSEGIDLAIRAGSLSDSSLIAKRLGIATWAPFASPSYLKRAGTPSHPKDLGKHSCLQFSPLGTEGWKFSNGRTTVVVPLPFEIGGNDVNLIKALAVSGNGIALLPTFACLNEIKDRKLIQILSEWSVFSDPIHLVYPRQKFVPLKVRAFVDVATEEFRLILRD